MKNSRIFWGITAIIGLSLAVVSAYAAYSRLSSHITLPVSSASLGRQLASDVPMPEEPAQDAQDQTPTDTNTPQTEKAAKTEPAREIQKPRAVKVLFEHVNGKAKTVLLAGSFTRWKDVRMQKKDGIWKAEVYILPGNYLYHFTVDGKKVLDQANAKAGVGESIVEVKQQ